MMSPRRLERLYRSAPVAHLPFLFSSSFFSHRDCQLLFDCTGRLTLDALPPQPIFFHYSCVISPHAHPVIPSVSRHTLYPTQNRANRLVRHLFKYQLLGNPIFTVLSIFLCQIVAMYIPGKPQYRMKKRKEMALDMSRHISVLPMDPGG